SPGPGRRVGSLRPRLDHIASRHRANPVVTLRWNDDAEDILTAARRAVVAGDEREIHEATCVLAADAVELRAATRVAAGARGRAERGDRGGGIRRIHADRAHAAVRPDVARVGGGRPPAQVRPPVEIERDYDDVVTVTLPVPGGGGGGGGGSVPQLTSNWVLANSPRSDCTVRGLSPLTAQFAATSESSTV